MKALGIVMLVAGLLLGGYAINMKVSVGVPAQDFGYGVKSPAMEVANVDRMAQRQNLVIFAGLVSLAGAVLIGFGTLGAQPVPRPDVEPLPTTSAALEPTASSGPTSVSICPECRHMGAGDATVCARCEAPIPA